MIKDLQLVRATTDRSGQQVLDLPLQIGIGPDADGVLVVFAFQQPHQIRQGKGRVASKELGGRRSADTARDGGDPKAMAKMMWSMHGP